MKAAARDIVAHKTIIDSEWNTNVRYRGCIPLAELRPNELNLGEFLFVYNIKKAPSCTGRGYFYDEQWMFLLVDVDRIHSRYLDCDTFVHLLPPSERRINCVQDNSRNVLHFAEKMKGLVREFDRLGSRSWELTKCSDD